jgi:putative SOS response-associated peptidase YedK
MYERYVLPEQSVAEREFLPAKAWWKFEPRFNVSAGQYVPSLRRHEGITEAVMMRWGLVPAWAEGTPLPEPTTLAKLSRVEGSEIFRGAWYAGQRCILPVAGFYAWQMTAARYRQPHFVQLPDRPVFGLAAIWDRSESEDGDVIESCAIIGVAANELLAAVAHPSRGMPAILRRRDYQAWLHGTAAEAMAALQPYRADWMLAYPVSPRINSVAADDPGLIRPVAAAESTNLSGR